MTFKQVLNTWNLFWTINIALHWNQLDIARKQCHDYAFLVQWFCAENPVKIWIFFIFSVTTNKW